MPATTKTDNHNPAAKLALRRYFLEKYHATDPPLVLDCCQGSMQLWGVLRQEFPATRYFGVDLKPKSGRLKIDSSRLIAAGGWDYNVIDVDTYGSPWKHWAAILKHARHPVTVFLTVGLVTPGGGNYDRALLPFVGLHFTELKLPNSLGVRINDLGTTYAINAPAKAGLRAVDIQEAFPSGSARYLGVRLAP